MIWGDRGANVVSDSMITSFGDAHALISGATKKRLQGENSHFKLDEEVIARIHCDSVPCASRASNHRRTAYSLGSNISYHVVRSTTLSHAISTRTELGYMNTLQETGEALISKL